jgi:hypothetical protein
MSKDSRITRVRPRRVLRFLAIAAVSAAVLSGCQPGFGTSAQTPVISGPCSFGGLILVPVVCTRVQPAQRPDGTWMYPLANRQAAQLHAGSILIVARKAVRRVVSARRSGSEVILTTAAVPATEVIRDGTIRLRAVIRPRDVKRVPLRPRPVLPPEPLPVRPPHTPVATQSSGPPPPPTVTVSISAVGDGIYRGPCPVPVGSGPEFKAVISVSTGPVIVHFHWTASSASGLAADGGTASSSGQVSFRGTGFQTATVSYAVPITPNGIGHHDIDFGQVQFQADTPVTKIAPEQPVYRTYCTPPGTSSPPPGSTSPVVGAPAGQQGALLAMDGLTIDHYQITPSLALGKNSFQVDIAATRQVGPARLTWRVYGQLSGFQSAGTIRIASHHLRQSRMALSGLHGTLRLDWSLAADVPEGITQLLSLDLPIPLAVYPFAVGDFPVFLTLELHLHVSPEFRPGPALHGFASISFSGGSGMSVGAQAIDHADGPSASGLRLDPGIRNLFRIPTLNASVDFPYLSLSSDIYAANAWLWTTPSLHLALMPGANPDLCVRAAADASAAAGIGFELFGQRAELSHQIFDHPLPPTVSFPAHPTCSAH